MTISALIDIDQAAARARAAIAYAGLTMDDAAARTGIAIRTLGRITAQTNPRGATLDELFVIADACGVPRAFMEKGWDLYDAERGPVDVAAEAVESLVDHHLKDRRPE